MQQVSGMDIFKKAKTIRLKSHHEKYLSADPDKTSVTQDRWISSKSAKWTVEFVKEAENIIRLKSHHGTYLTASDEEFLLGVTGRKVIQTQPRKLDSSVEWEPIREGMQVKLKTRYGNYLRANGGVPPWRNSVTHDIPHRHHHWILWDVDVVETRVETNETVANVSITKDVDDDEEDDDLCSEFDLRLQSLKSSSPSEDPSRISEGRTIYYSVVDDDGNANDEAEEGPCFQFKGHRLEELAQKLEEETGIEDIIVCSRNRVNGKLYPLRLALPPNNATMHVVVVPITSKAAKEFLPATPSTEDVSSS